MRIIAVSNQKGGVGKTTSAVNLAAGLARAGKEVLLIDLDAQGSSTASFGHEPEELKCSMADLFQAIINKDNIEVKIEEAMIPVQERLTLLPANLDLCPVETILVTVISREYILKKIIDKTVALHSHGYDYVIIDCAPGLTTITLNAFAAADDILIPIKAQFLDYKGFNQLYQHIMMVKEDLNPKLKIIGAFLTMYDGRLSLARTIKDAIGAIGQIEENFHIHMLNTKISQCTKAAEAPLAGKDIFSFAPNSKTATEYKELVGEILLEG